MTISLNNLSVVIVSFHSEDVIHNCIRSITDNIQIIVVENSGNKDFARKLEGKYKNVKCILSDKNLGMGAGNNLGIRNVTTDYVFILNPDIVLEKKAIEEILIASKKLLFLNWSIFFNILRFNIIAKPSILSTLNGSILLIDLFILLIL